MALRPTQQFRRAIQDDPTKCILWVGAGLSVVDVRQGGKGLPDWNALMQRMIEDLRDSESCEASTLESLQAALKQGKYLEVAQAYKQRMRPDQFAAFIKGQLDPPDVGKSRIHQVILKVGFRGIITTNFDRVFERQSDLLAPLIYPQCLDDVDGFRRDGFFAKIHGCVRLTPNLAENLILTEESFRSLRSNPKYQTILRSCIVMHPLLTAGFSLNDPDFLALVSDLRESLGNAMPTIYSLMCDSGTKARDDWLARGVQTIPYSNHSELLGFFQKMLALSKKRHPAPTLEAASKLPQIDFGEARSKEPTAAQEERARVSAANLPKKKLAAFKAGLPWLLAVAAFFRDNLTDPITLTVLILAGLWFLWILLGYAREGKFKLAGKWLGLLVLSVFVCWLSYDHVQKGRLGAKLQDPLFREVATKVFLQFGNGGATFGMDPAQLKKGKVSPITISHAGTNLSPFDVYIENGTLFCDFKCAGNEAHPGFELRHNVLKGRLYNCDLNKNESALEVVDDKRRPIFQLYYKSSTHLVLNGEFDFVGGGVSALPLGLRPIFKYPAWRHPGEYADE